MQPCGWFDIGYNRSMAVIKTNLQWALLLSFLVLLFILPLFLSPYMLTIMNIMGVSLIAVLGLQILMGYCGQINLGQAAFVGVGAFTSANLVLKMGLPFWVALPCAGLFTGLIGIMVGISSLRIKGFYLALATVAFQIIFEYVAISAMPLTGGVYGMNAPAPRLGGIVFDSDRSMYFIIMVAAVILTVVAKNLTRMKAGRAFVAIRDNDIAAHAMGISLFRYKLLAFFISSVYAGIAGSLLAHYMGRISYSYFTLMDSIWYIGIMIIGGTGSIAGVVFGVVFITGLDQLAGFIAPQIAEVFPALGEGISASLALMLFAVIFILFLIFEPRGLAHRWEMFKAYYRLWPFSY